MKRIALTTLIAALGLTSSFAAQPSFNFIETGYVANEIDGEDSDGFTIRGNVSLNKHFYVAAAYEISDYDDIDLDTDTATIGIGYRIELNNNSALYSQFSYFDTDADSKTLTVSGVDGLKLGLGIRTQLLSKTQTYGEVTHIKTDYDSGSSSATEVTLGLKQNLTSELAGFVEYSKNDREANNYSIGISYNF